MGQPRPLSLHVTLSNDELGMLHELAEDRGVTVSDVVRMTLRDRYFEKFGEKPVDEVLAKLRGETP